MIESPIVGIGQSMYVALFTSKASLPACLTSQIIEWMDETKATINEKRFSLQDKRPSLPNCLEDFSITKKLIIKKKLKI